MDILPEHSFRQDTGWESSIRLTSGIMAVAMRELPML